MRCLERLRQEGTTELVYIAAEPLFESLRGDPGFERLLDELNLGG